MIGKRLRLARKAEDITQETLAAMVGVKPVTVSRWEGDKQEPSVQMLKEIASALEGIKPSGQQMTINVTRPIFTGLVTFLFDSE